MAQFDVCHNPRSETRDHIPYLLLVQSDLLDAISTRVVVPLISASHYRRPAKHLNPTFEIAGTRVVMLTEQIAGIPKSALGERVGSLKANRDQILEALDFLVTGV